MVPGRREALRGKRPFQSKGTPAGVRLSAAECGVWAAARARVWGAGHRGGELWRGATEEVRAGTSSGGPSVEPGLRESIARPSKAGRGRLLRARERPSGPAGSERGWAPTERPRRASQWSLQKDLREGRGPRPWDRFLDLSATRTLNGSPLAVGRPAHCQMSGSIPCSTQRTPATPAPTCDDSKRV